MLFRSFLAGFSCILLLLGIGEFFSLNRKEKKKDLILQESANLGKIQQRIDFFPELKNYLQKTKKTLFETNFGKIWGIAILLYGTTGIINANYADYSVSFLTKPELGLAISASYLAEMLSSLIAGRISIDSKNIVRLSIILAAGGIFLSVKMPLLAFFLIGAGGGTTVVGLITTVSKISSSGFVMGLFNTGIYAGLGLGPVLGSFFLEPLGYETVFIVSSVALLTVLFVKIE